MVIIKMEKVYENFLDRNEAPRELIDFSATVDFDPEKVVAKCKILHLIQLAHCLDLSTLCVEFAIDAEQVVAHLDPKPLDIKKTEECLKYLSKDKDAATVAVVAQSEAVFVNFAYHAAKDHPELIDQLDEFVNGFRKHVHNCLITKLSK